MPTPHKPASASVTDHALRAFERRYGHLGGRELRTVPFVVDEIRADQRSGDPNSDFSIIGHAAVFDQWSLDLGFFREKIKRGAFDDVLSRNPDVWHLWDHDTRWVLSRTVNKTLELSIDPRGLRYYSRPAKTSYASDLRTLIERGDVNQSSFAFTVEEDEWVIRDVDGEEEIERTIVKVGDLYDVTTTAMGAYPQTDSSVGRSKVNEYLQSTGRLPGGAFGVAPAETDPAGTGESRKGSALRLARIKARQLKTPTPKETNE